MARDIAFTTQERAVFLALHGEGNSARHIGRFIHRGHDAELHVIRSGLFVVGVACMVYGEMSLFERFN